MEPLLQIINLELGPGREPAPLSFTLMQGEARTLPMGSQGDAATLVDALLGRAFPASGTILFRGRPLSADDTNRIGWVAANGGLISSLTIWENVTLPLCYHRREPPPDMETEVARWLAAVGVADASQADFLSRWPAQLGPVERKQAGLVRGLLHGSALLLLEGRLFADVPPALHETWEQAVLGGFRRDQERGLLVVAPPGVAVPWGGGNRAAQPT